MVLAVANNESWEGIAREDGQRGLLFIFNGAIALEFLVDKEHLDAQLIDFDAGTERKEELKSRKLATYKVRFMAMGRMSNTQQSLEGARQTSCCLIDMAEESLRPLALVT